MIWRCKGINCSLKETCYRWLLKHSNNPNDYMQSMYSTMHNDCRNYWKVKSKNDNTGADIHARMLNNMIDRINKDNYRN